jgi:hypothetical protein
VHQRSPSPWRCWLWSRASLSRAPTSATTRGVAASATAKIELPHLQIPGSLNPPSPDLRHAEPASGRTNVPPEEEGRDREQDLSLPTQGELLLLWTVGRLPTLHAATRRRARAERRARVAGRGAARRRHPRSCAAILKAARGAPASGRQPPRPDCFARATDRHTMRTRSTSYAPCFTAGGRAPSDASTASASASAPHTAARASVSRWAPSPARWQDVSPQQRMPCAWRTGTPAPTTR